MRSRSALTARVIAAAALTGTLAAWTSSTPKPPTRAELYKALTGDWTGALEYKDYSRPDKRVTLPTKLRIQLAPDSSAVLMHFTYDDGPGKTVEDDDRFSADRAVATITWGGIKDSLPQRFTVREAPGSRGAGNIALILEGEGSDDNKPATIRETFEITGNTLHILKETRPTGGEFGFRHEYRFKR